MATLAAEVREMVEEQIRFRSLLVQMTKRDLLLRYKQTVMGFAWAVFMPLIQTGIFATVISRVSNFDPGIPYPLFAFTGVLAWNFFAISIRFASISLSGNTALVSKVYFPREIFPLSQVLVCFVDSLVAGLVVIGLMVWYGVMPGVQVILLPLIFLVHILWTAAASFVLAAANLFFRDVKYIVEGLLTVAMFSTTALYPSSEFSGAVGLIMRLNPISAVIDAYRNALFYNTPVLTQGFLLSALAGMFFFGLSWLIFHRAEHMFAERV
ncbi:MAG: ABC transporter permease [Gemmatimonadota bacterium]|nr:ABC transporter permease [Gemmatimonadota bacterium]